MKLSLRAKGVLALFILIFYLVGIGLFVANERTNVDRIASQIEQNHVRQSFLSSLVKSLGHSLVQTQAILSDSRVDHLKLTSSDPVARNLARIRADLAQIEETFPSLKNDIDGFGDAIESFDTQDHKEALTDIRNHQQRLIAQLNDIIAAMQSQHLYDIEKYNNTQQFISVVALLGNVSAILGSVAFILIFFTRLARDIKLVESRAVAVVAGYDGPALPRTRNDEVGSLTDAVNRLQVDLRRWEQKQEISRQQRFHQEKMAAVGSLAAAISHEVNNPIAAISGAAQFMIDSTRGAKDSGIAAIHAFAEQIWQQTERVGAIMKRMATLTATRSSECELIDLNQLVESTCSFIVFDPRFCGVRLDLDLDHSIPAVNAVSDHLTQVLMNLLINAADAADHSGDKGLLRIVVSTGCAQDAILLSVIDNGTGMDPEVMARAFDDSFTTKPAGKGRGIGLFLCKTLISGDGGRIELDSTLGVGTRVDVFLPMKPSNRESKAED